MTIGTALVIIAILYFIDKHHLWKRAALVCLIVLIAALMGFSGYYGWQRMRESRAANETLGPRKSKMDLSAGIVPDWTIPLPPKGFIPDDVAFAILYPIKADAALKTDAWTWFRNSECAIGGNPSSPADSIAHDSDLFNLESYDARWMKDISLPQEVRRALWAAKAKECQLPPGSQDVPACLNRAKGTVEEYPWVTYGGNCSPGEEKVLLSDEPEAKK